MLPWTLKLLLSIVWLTSCNYTLIVLAVINLCQICHQYLHCPWLVERKPYHHDVLQVLIWELYLWKSWHTIWLSLMAVKTDCHLNFIKACSCNVLDIDADVMPNNWQRLRHADTSMTPLNSNQLFGLVLRLVFLALFFFGYSFDHLLFVFLMDDSNFKQSILMHSVHYE